MRVFENPENGYREEVGTSAGVATFFLGFVYLAFKGLWQHVIAILVGLIVLYALFGESTPVYSVSVFVVWFSYAVAAPEIIANSYLRRGWKEIEEEGLSTPSDDPPPDLVLNPFMNNRLPEMPKATVPASKKCPFCAEEVKFEAIKCKHCQSDFSAV